LAFGVACWRLVAPLETPTAKQQRVVADFPKGSGLHPRLVGKTGGDVAAILGEPDSTGKVYELPGEKSFWQYDKTYPFTVYVHFNDDDKVSRVILFNGSCLD